jgi:Flp pilus assembly protein TadG
VILLLGTIGVALALLLSGFTADLASASTLRTRAQLAADAAALAAVAESGPYGDGEHERAAARFAVANGARLLECLCEPGATAVQVRVAIEDVVADARATFDPEMLMPGDGYAGDGLHPLLQTSVDRLLNAATGAVTLVSGRRSTERQSELWVEALARYGDPEIADDWVARPGTSMHERGLAVDLGGDLTLAARLVEHLDLPLHRPMAHEPHHFELVQ